MATEQEISEIREIVEENNKILRGLRARARINMTVNAVKWIVFLAIALGLYTFVQPYLSQIAETYSSIKESVTTIQELKESVPSAPEINLKSLLNI